MTEPPEANLSIADHLSRLLAETDEEGKTYAEAIALAWLKTALKGNVPALKEILVRLAPIKDAGPKTVRYILDRDPNWDNDCSPADHASIRQEQLER
jgi:hypothetical protein